MVRTHHSDVVTTRGSPSLQWLVNTSHPFSVQAPQLASKGKWQHYLFNQYGVGLQSRAHIFHRPQERIPRGWDDQHPLARYLNSKHWQKRSSNTFHGLILLASPLPWRSLVLSTDSTNTEGSKLGLCESDAEFFSSTWGLYVELLWSCTQHF